MELDTLRELLEDSDAIYHKHVSQIQLEAQEQKQAITEKNRKDIDDYLDSHIEENIDTVIDHFDMILQININKVRTNAAFFIAQLMQIRKDRDTALLHFAEKDA